jgi:FG-GAP repeat protein
MGTTTYSRYRFASVIIFCLAPCALSQSPPPVSFQAAGNYAVGAGPRSVAMGDFNGDGKLDLAVANQNSNDVSVLLGNGDGTF